MFKSLLSLNCVNTKLCAVYKDPLEQRLEAAFINNLNDLDNQIRMQYTRYLFLIISDMTACCKAAVNVISSQRRAVLQAVLACSAKIKHRCMVP